MIAIAITIAITHSQNQKLAMDANTQHNTMADTKEKALAGYEARTESGPEEQAEGLGESSGVDVELEGVRGEDGVGDDAAPHPHDDNAKRRDRSPPPIDDQTEDHPPPGICYTL